MVTSGWPNNLLWRAMFEGEVAYGERTMTLGVIDCGTLYLPSGRLVVCDPFATMRQHHNPEIQVPPGRYPVRVTLADVSETHDGSHIREAYASLVLSPDREEFRRLLTPLFAGETPPVLEPGSFIGFTVDAGTGCFVDAESLSQAMPDESSWHEQLFDNPDPASWFNRMDDPHHIREGLANIALPHGKGGENLVLFHTGWGDGIYPVIGGYSRAGSLVAVHVDFMVVPDDDDTDL